MNYIVSRRCGSKVKVTVNLNVKIGFNNLSQTPKITKSKVLKTQEYH